MQEPEKTSSLPGEEASGGAWRAVLWRYCSNIRPCPAQGIALLNSQSPIQKINAHTYNHNMRVFVCVCVSGFDILYIY